MTPEIQIDGLTFEGFAPAYAERAAQVFEAAISDGIADISFTESRALERLDLSGLDFTSPETLGRSLARAILAEMSQ